MQLYENINEKKRLPKTFIKLQLQYLQSFYFKVKNIASCVNLAYTFLIYNSFPFPLSISSIYSFLYSHDCAHCNEISQITVVKALYFRH